MAVRGKKEVGILLCTYNVGLYGDFPTSRNRNRSISSLEKIQGKGITITIDFL
jgi:hypothetical protein